MDARIGDAQSAEKPGRLQLAIVEWQRQLVQRREARILGQPKSNGGADESGRGQVLQDRSAAA